MTSNYMMGLIFPLSVTVNDFWNGNYESDSLSPWPLHFYFPRLCAQFHFVFIFSSFFKINCCKHCERKVVGALNPLGYTNTTPNLTVNSALAAILMR